MVQAPHQCSVSVAFLFEAALQCQRAYSYPVPIERGVIKAGVEWAESGRAPLSRGMDISTGLGRG
jgi:hypothetical protein